LKKYSNKKQGAGAGSHQIIQTPLLVIRQRRLYLTTKRGAFDLFDD
jgi:hypothetical protein